MDSEAFTGLVHEHADAVRAFIWRRAGGLDVGVSTPDDFHSEVWAVAWQRRLTAPDVANSAACRAWLLQISRHLIANHIRKTVGHRETDRMLRPSEVLAASAEAIAVADLELQRAIAALQPAEREALALSVWEGLTPKQIAVVTNSSANAVSIRLHRARKKLAAALG